MKFKETGQEQNSNMGAEFSGKLQIVPKTMGVALAGYVYDVDDNPMNGVTVELHSDPIITTTDTNGYYEILDVPVGTHTLYIKQGETTLGSKSITLISSTESKIENNQQLKLPETIKSYVNIKVDNGLNIYLEEKTVSLKWKKNFGGTSSDIFHSVIEVSDGYVAIGNSYSNDVDLIGKGNTSQDALIVKYGLDGDVEWSRNFGGSSSEEFVSVTAVSDGYIVVGYSASTDGDLAGLKSSSYNDDAIIVKYELDGDVEWKRIFGGNASDRFYSIVAVSDGYIVVGSSQSNDINLAGLNKGNIDAIIVKYELDGDVEWNENFGGNASDHFYSIVAVSDGYVVVGNSYSSNADLADLTQSGGTDAIIVKYGLDRDIDWVKNYGGSKHDYFNSVVAVSDGYIIVGYSTSKDGELTEINKSTSGEDAIIVKYELNGDVEWAEGFGGDSGDVFHSVAVVLDGYVAVGNSYSSNVDLTGLNKGDQDAIMVKYDTNGSLAWKKNYGGSVSDIFKSVIAASEEYIAVGYSQSPNKDLTGLNMYGSYDAIIFAFEE